MIPIEITGERRLIDGKRTASISFDKEYARAFMDLQDRAEATGAKIGLALIQERAEVQPVADVFLSEVETKLQDIITGIETYKSSKTMGEEQHAESVEQV